MLKRAFDTILIAASMPLWIPLLLVVAILVRLFMGRPVLFRQRRPGLDGRPFVLLKFRTMTQGSTLDKAHEADVDRLTRFGSWLRSTSLDELPELWNVLRGEMSLVGPRPLLMEYIPLYTAEQARRHSVRPGITGWAQVNGRNLLDWEERLAMDTWYVDNRSFLLDLRILAISVERVLSRRGIAAAGDATMPRFGGSR